MVQTHLGYYAGPSNTDLIQNGGNATLNDLTVGGTAQFADLNASGSATLSELTVTGSAFVGGSLVVDGGLTVSGTADLATAQIGELHVTSSAIFDQDISVGGHIITAGDKPTVQVQDGAGTPDPDNPDAQDAKITISGDDTTGTITITTSDDPGAGSLAKIIFSKTYGAAPHIVLSASNDNAAGLRFFKGDTSKTDFMLNALNAPDANTTYKFDYFIAQ
jgi:hypothetical protein